VSHWCPAFENQGISNKNPEFWPPWRYRILTMVTLTTTLFTQEKVPSRSAHTFSLSHMFFPHIPSPLNFLLLVA
jgi:hypothetical protein